MGTGDPQSGHWRPNQIGHIEDYDESKNQEIERPLNTPSKFKRDNYN
jgi:hypothetical protein